MSMVFWWSHKCSERDFKTPLIPLDHAMFAHDNLEDRAIYIKGRSLSHNNICVTWCLLVTLETDGVFWSASLSLSLSLALIIKASYLYLCIQRWKTGSHSTCKDISGSASHAALTLNPTVLSSPMLSERQINNMFIVTMITLATDNCFLIRQTKVC